MTADICVCRPDDSIRHCAQAMQRNDIGALAVAENNLLVGMVTDRDIVVRGTAAGKGPETPVREVLSGEVLFCYDDQDIGHVAQSMGVAKIRRVPVLRRDRRVVGMLSLADVARASGDAAGAALASLSKPGGPHSPQRQP